MRILALIVLLLAFAAPAQAMRVVSLNLCTDELLLTLAPEQAVAVSPLAAAPGLSVVAKAAREVPEVRPDAEAVLALHPDLVLAGTYGAQTTLALLEGNGVRVERFGLAPDFPAIAAELTRAGEVLGVPGRAATAITAMRARLAALNPPAHAGAALVLEARGWTAGPGTLADAVLRAAGWANAGSGRQLGLEALLAHPPALLVTTPPPDFPSLATDFLAHPALAALPRREIPPPLLLCGGPWSVAAAEILAR
jgi:iron complex transport system substrate-binding protein